MHASQRQWTRATAIGDNRRVYDLGPLTDDQIGTQTRRIGTAEHFRWLETIIRVVLVLNMLDALLTLVWVYSGFATEANPLMEDLVHNHPVMFVVVKFSLVTLGSVLLLRLRKRPMSVVAIFFAFLAYYCILLYHLQAMDLRLFRRWFD